MKCRSQKVSLMRLTTKTNLAVRVLMACAVNDSRTLRSAEIATACNASLNHLLQVVNAIQTHGFVDTLRGRNGGLRLARPADQISIGDVFRVLEAGMPFAECFAPDTNTCPLATTCRLRGYLQRAVEAFYHELDMITLEDLTKGNCGLTALLAVPDSLRRNCSESAPA
jgi:Rrf2 family transcriptional regulator, nitric oxide-sensitive transcriptional repressor